MQAAVFSAVVTGSGTLTMQIANGDAGAYQCIAVEAFNPGAGRSWGSNRVDGTPAGAVDSSNDFTSFSSGNVSTTADGIIVGVVQVDVSDDGTITQDGAFTLVYESETGSTDNTGSAIYRIVSSGTTDSADWSLSFSTKFGVAGIAVAYRQEPQVTYVSSPSIVTNDFGGSAGTHTATVPTSKAKSCTACGKCVQACPTGAIFRRGVTVSEMERDRWRLEFIVTAREKQQWIR